MKATDEMTISMRTILDTDSHQYAVEMVVYGVASLEDAYRVQDHLRELLCGEEKILNLRPN